MEAELVSPDEIHVACDTGIFRSVLHNEAPWLADFEAMAKAGVVFSLADHALAEIVNQLEEKKFSGEDYARAIRACARFVSSKVPILPGKKELAIWCDQNPDAAFIKDDETYRLAWWNLMTRATRIEDFQKGVDFKLQDGRAQRATNKPGDATKALEDERNKWRTHLNTGQKDAAKNAISERQPPLAGDLDDDINCIPKLTVRLEAALLHATEMERLRNNPKKPLNPDSEKRRNDGIDFNMSFVFMKRIILCTADKNYRNAIRRIESYQSDWVYLPQELVDAWKAGSLSRPRWPTVAKKIN